MGKVTLVPLSLGRGQKTIYRNRLTPFTLQVPPVKLFRLVSRHFYHLIQLAHPHRLLSKALLHRPYPYKCKKA